MGVLRLHKVSFQSLNGSTGETVQFHFRGGPIGAPIYVPADGVFKDFPDPTDSAPYPDPGTMDVYQNGVRIGMGATGIGPVAGQTGNNHFNCIGLGKFIVNFEVI